MNSVLLTAGAACIIIAVVGGGAKAFGVEVPVLNSRVRQLALGLVGVAFLGAAFVVGNGDNGTNAEVRGYRQEVLATCRSLQGIRESGAPQPDENGQFHRDSFVALLRSQLDSSRSVLADLWKLRVPAALKDDASDARHAANRLLKRTKTALDRLVSDLPETFDLFSLPQIAQQLNSELEPPSARFERSMSRLAGAACRPAVSTGNAGA
jgi:hypothetical protein